MNNRLAAASAALKAGRRDEAIDELATAISEDPGQPANVYNTLLVQLYQAGRHEEGQAIGARAMAQHPRDFNIANVRGVMLRRLGRLEEALDVLDAAVRIDPRQEAPQVNRSNVLLDLNRGRQAEEALTKLVRLAPRNAEYQRLLGRALANQNRRDAAVVRFRQAVAIKKDLIEGWLDLAGALNELDRTKQAEEALDKGLAATPGHARLLEAKALVMRRAGEARRAEAYLQSLLPEHDEGWLHYQLGTTVAEYDRPRGNTHLRRAVELAPEDATYLVGLVESLERTRGVDEGRNIEEAYQLAKAALARGVVFKGPGPTKVLFEVLQRVGDYEALKKLGDFRSLGRLWAESGRHTALFKQLGLVQSEADRQELLEQHRIWARLTEARANESPIRHSKPRTPDGRIRLGLMSSDLRRHPVGYFAMPLFEHIDERFDLYCYSYNLGAEDDVQKYMASRSKAFRLNPDISVRNAAQLIADDQLDILIELGGSTFMNKLEVMAYKPAPRQASWLGYPHSAGLSTIDYLLVDPYLMPERPELLLEKPLMLPQAWYPLGSFHFRPEPAANPEPPVARNGFITFGTANNPQKYTPQVIQTWAKVLRETPNSQFLFVRPEGAAPSFRTNLSAIFEACGVAPERIRFEPVRGAHLPHYNRIDITLDCFPQTGGTTTCESLWMGAPCVTLVGDGVFERLSYSVLMNLGLGELCARTLDEFVAVAATLASDPARIAELRASLRQRMQESALGQTERWARDFYEAVARTVLGA
jgi:predicted O-linked N-acetylglucosamine transferase (SPINDLY family)